MDIFINVINQDMRITATADRLVEDSQDFVKFRFNFTDNWNGLVVFAQFTQNGESYNKYLDSNNCVTLPPEIKAGKCTMVLYGSKNNVIATTTAITLKVGEYILVSDAQSTEITESLYNQLVDRVDEISDAFSNGITWGQLKNGI